MDVKLALFGLRYSSWSGFAATNNKGLRCSGWHVSVSVVLTGFSAALLHRRGALQGCAPHESLGLLRVSLNTNLPDPNASPPNPSALEPEAVSPTKDPLGQAEVCSAEPRQAPCALVMKCFGRFFCHGVEGFRGVLGFRT